MSKSAKDYLRDARKEYRDAQMMNRFIVEGSSLYNKNDVFNAYLNSAKNWLSYLKKSPLSKINKLNKLKEVSGLLNYAVKIAPNLCIKEETLSKKKSVDSTITTLSEKIPKNKLHIERRVLGYAILSITSLVFALIFTSFSLTGYSVMELTQNNFRFFGTIFFILGLVFAFVYFKKKKNQNGNT
jgi:hypothetical protein